MDFWRTVFRLLPQMHSYSGKMDVLLDASKTLRAVKNNYLAIKIAQGKLITLLTFESNVAVVSTKVMLRQ